jgi:uncharacterized membrane protein
MRYTLPQSLWAEHVIPPRCRKPQQAHIQFEVSGEILELPADAIRRVATLPDGTALHHHPATGFLTPQRWTLSELLAHMTDQYPGRYPASSMGRQVEALVVEATLKKQAELDGYVLGGGVLYGKAAEPVYLVEFRHSMSWNSDVQLSVTDAPACDEEAYGIGRHQGRLPYAGRFYNARDRRAARRAIVAIARAYRTVREEARAARIEATARIDIQDPEVFTFDARAWHTAAETARLRDRLQELRTAVSEESIAEPHLTPLYPERIALSAQMRAELDRLLGTLPDHPNATDAEQSAS